MKVIKAKAASIILYIYSCGFAAFFGFYLATAWNTVDHIFVTLLAIGSAMCLGLVAVLEKMDKGTTRGRPM